MYVLKQAVFMLFNLSYDDGVSQAYQHLATLRRIAAPRAYSRALWHSDDGLQPSSSAHPTHRRVQM